MTRIRRMMVLCAALGIAAAACSDSATAPEKETNRIAAEEARGLFVTLAAMAADTTAEIVSSNEQRVVYACKGGGQYTGEFDIQTGVGALSWAIVITPNACVVTVGGATFTLDGSPSLRTEATMTMSGSGEGVRLTAVTGTSKGALQWKTGDRSGVCEVDVRLVVEDLSQLNPARPKVTGTICGHAVDFTGENLGVPITFV